MLLFIQISQDKRVLKYELNLEFYGDVNVEKSYYEFSSVGRIYVNLTKTYSPERWERLLKQKEKMPNMQMWWEMHEKYEQYLSRFKRFDYDADFHDSYDGNPKEFSSEKDNKKTKKKKENKV